MSAMTKEEQRAELIRLINDLHELNKLNPYYGARADSSVTRQRPWRENIIDQETGECPYMPGHYPYGRIKRKCTSITKNGKPCTRYEIDSTNLCAIHTVVVDKPVIVVEDVDKPAVVEDVDTKAKPKRKQKGKPCTMLTKKGYPCTQFGIHGTDKCLFHSKKK